MKKLIITAVIAALMLVGIAAGTLIKEKTNAELGSYSVALNEIEKLYENGDTAAASQRTEDLRHDLMTHRSTGSRSVILMCAVCLVFLSLVCIYTVSVVIKPFYKLTGFAERVALGDLDTPLRYEKTNLFGKFTWAFDSMRNEISKARACEREAIDNNKTVTAALSHDIKTPVASIRAYAEALEIGMASPEKQMEYINVIMKKCDEVTKITNDMLTHSLTELDRLKMSPEIFELGGFVNDTINELCTEDISYERPLTDIYVNADKGRITQVIENIISNSKKYAGSAVEVSLTIHEDIAVMSFTDHGGGIQDEDMPFVMNKFYRGNNSKNTDGAGLGLYIVKYITEQSGGSVRLTNTNDGLKVDVLLPIVK
ncbi:MAG: HAMP domain-containing histidine kinase [Oscillospiraceae bacterium]|nr:HAMP domain-containing histidine kinase [Oscillospiraceae bacterium]